ncbi:MAG TPA: c-type cytochrome biogenesis protein CcsB [Burkholderiaceae bacterium]|nr:c-type cytochrome biogenesis protein CcsB [Burkholderiaceae bacterium]
MNTTTMTLGRSTGPLGLFSGRSWYDWLFAAVVLAGGVFAFSRYAVAMDVYEKAILIGALPVAIALGWFWGAMRTLMLGVAMATLLAIGLYNQHLDNFGADLAQADHVFLLKYFLSSQSAILWMGVLFFMSTAFYWIGLFAKRADNAAVRIASRLAWVAVFMALTGTMVRWFESHQIAPDIGHIPVSNLYEVFVLFCWLTTLFYLYYEQHYGARLGAAGAGETPGADTAGGAGIGGMGAFVMLVVSAAVGFLLWYTVAREAQEIQPLVPALQSWWMKLHVPANFIGYGSFSLSAMVAFAYLVKRHASETNWLKLVPLLGLGIVLCIEPLVFRKNPIEAISSYWAVYFGLGALIVGGILLARRRIAERLPSADVLDDVMYKSIAVGFAFFTIATILGAFWAAEAWGGYWSWDPKETWALIVWLNYAAWLHMRLIKGLRGAVSAWWALTGLVVTTFAFLGVNMFLSGLHSYGQL